MHRNLIFLILLLLSCATTRPMTGLSSDGKLLKEVLKNPDIKPTERAIITKVISDLNDAEKQQREAQKKLDAAQKHELSNAEDAGAGKLVYRAGVFVLAAAGLFVAWKLLSRFGLI